MPASGLKSTFRIPYAFDIPTGCPLAAMCRVSNSGNAARVRFGTLRRSPIVFSPNRFAVVRSTAIASRSWNGVWWPSA